jgi:hypothetical protein
VGSDLGEGVICYANGDIKSTATINAVDGFELNGSDLKNTDLSSSTSTLGLVITSNGAGGSSWQNPGSVSSTLDSLYYFPTNEYSSAGWILTDDTIKVDTTATNIWTTDSNGINYQSGNVGINNTSSSSIALKVTGETEFTGLTAIGAAKFNSSYIMNVSGDATKSGAFIKTSDSGGYGLYVSQTAVGIGIGAAVPNGTALSISGSKGAVITGQGGAAQPALELNHTGSGNLIEDASSNFTVNQSGDITASKINCDSIFTTKAGAWADHVFEEDYYLPSLETELDYIKNARHLRSLPSERDRDKYLKKEWKHTKFQDKIIKKNGKESIVSIPIDSVLVEKISIQQMGQETAAILEETEKQYFYIEQLLNRIKNLELKNSELEKRIEKLEKK